MAQNVIEIITVMRDKLSGKTERMTKKIEQLGRGLQRTTTNIKRWEKGIRVSGKTISETTKGLHRFQMEMLSILFFGMFLQRIFLGIARAAVTSFTKIMESNDMLGTATQRLGVHFEFLKFTIGSAINTALEPLLPLIIDIIRGITEWVQQHPKLTSAIIGFGAALGIAFFSLATFKLGWDAIMILLTGSKLVKAMGNLKNLTGLLQGLAAVALLAISIDFFFKGIKEEDVKKALLLIVGSAFAGALATLIFASMAGAGAAAVPLAIGVGALILLVGLQIRFHFVEKIQDKITEAITTIQDRVRGFKGGGLSFGELFTGLKQQPTDIIFDLNRGIMDTRENIERLERTGKSAFGSLSESANKTGFMIGSATKGSFPLVYSLIQTEKEWVKMSTIAIDEIENIISALNRIPRNITTTINVRESSSGILNEIKRFI